MPRTPNLLITGYWPPTNEMLRPWCANPEQNPVGWIGRDWLGLGFDVHACFPEFPGVERSPWGRGVGTFQVDYRRASRDFWHFTSLLRPAAIVVFTRGRPGINWEIESRHRKLPLDRWKPSYGSPDRPTLLEPISSEPDFRNRHSSLPMDRIVQAVNHALAGQAAAAGAQAAIAFADRPVQPTDAPFAFINTSDEYGGSFVSEYTGYHACWYKDLHDSPSSPHRCFAAGHVHVGIDTPIHMARQATEITLREVIHHVRIQMDWQAGPPG